MAIVSYRNGLYLPAASVDAASTIASGILQIKWCK